MNFQENKNEFSGQKSSMPNGVACIRSKTACLYHDEKISVLRPEQRESWFEP